METTGLPTPHSSPGPSAATRWLAVLLLVVAAALAFMVWDRRQAASQVGTPALSDVLATTPTAADSPPRAITARGNLASDEQSTIELFERTSPSVVHVTSIATRRSRLSMNPVDVPQGTGTGFVWDNSGHVVTNFHVIEKGQSAQVTLSDNTTWPATIVGMAPDKDLAVLKIEAPTSQIRAITVGTSADLKVGQKVFAIGNPFGLDQTLTTGVVSGLDREIQSRTKRPIQGVIQTDASINPGNSGGPLLDSAGRLIGVNTAIFSPTGASAGIGFAVPVDTVNRFVPQLIQYGKVVKPGLGIHIGSGEVAQRLNIEGVLVIDAPEGSAAEAAGITGMRRGPNGRWILGDVIVGIDEKPVRSSADLFRQLDVRKVGDSVRLQVMRDGKERTVEVALQRLP